MTPNQKKLFDMLPPGEWMLRADIERMYGCGFALALTGLHKWQLIELEFRDNKQYMKRKTIDEISKIPPIIFKNKR